MAQLGKLAKVWGVDLPVQVLESAAGFYLGTLHPVQGPFSRESVEYWPTRSLAERALETGDWTQRLHS